MRGLGRTESDLLPFDRAGWLGGDVVDDTVHPLDLVDDLVGHLS